MAVGKGILQAKSGVQNLQQGMGENNPLNEMLGINSAQQKIIKIPLNLLDDNPYQDMYSMEEDELEWLANSIAEHGVLLPIIVIPQANGRYFILAGHRRRMGSQRAGKTDIPAIVREDITSVDDSLAKAIFHVTNLGARQKLKPSEKARAYKELDEAMKEGATSCRTTSEIAKITKENVRKIQRYMRLTELIPELLQMVDSEKLAFVAGVDLSYLSSLSQKEVLANSPGGVTPKQAEALKAARDKSGDVSKQQITQILFPVKKEKKVSAPCKLSKTVKKYLPKDVKENEVETVLIEALKLYTERREKSGKI